LQKDKAANIAAAEQSVRLKTAITEATSKSPAFNDTRLAGMYAEAFARLPTLKEKQDFLTSKGYGITANEDGTYKLGSDPISYTQDEVNEVLRNPSTAMAKILDARNARSTTMAAQTRANNAAAGTAAVQQSTIAKNSATVDKTEAQTSQIQSKTTPSATIKSTVPPIPSGLSKNVVTQVPAATVVAKTLPLAATPALSPLTPNSQTPIEPINQDSLANEVLSLKKLKDTADFELSKLNDSPRASQSMRDKFAKAKLEADALNQKYQEKNRQWVAYNYRREKGLVK
jgi:hypothetical protein